MRFRFEFISECRAISANADFVPQLLVLGRNSLRGPSRYILGARLTASKQSRHAISVLSNCDIGPADTTTNTVNRH